MKTKRRRVGRPKQLHTQRYDMRLEPETAEWGKTLPGGLSALVRGLLRDAYTRAHEKS